MAYYAGAGLLEKQLATEAGIDCMSSTYFLDDASPYLQHKQIWTQIASVTSRMSSFVFKYSKVDPDRSFRHFDQM